MVGEGGGEGWVSGGSGSEAPGGAEGCRDSTGVPGGLVPASSGTNAQMFYVLL